jgi:L-malate glycosyltransferase
MTLCEHGNDTMNILYFSRAYTTHDRRFLKKLSQHAGRVFFLQFEDDGVNYESRPLPDGVERVEWLGGRRAPHAPGDFLESLPHLDAAIQKIRPDAIQAGPVLSCAFLAALIGGRPLFTVSWGSDILVESDRTEWNKWATLFTLKRTDIFVCDCLPVKSKAQAMYPLPDDRVVMFPWGIEIGRYDGNDSGHRSSREELGWNNCCVVVSTRSWHPDYGIDLVVEAFAEAYRSNSSLRLLLLGDGPAEQDIFKRIESLGLSHVVSCPGRVAEEEIVGKLLAADIYLCCTPSDGTSVSLLEAMAMRLPVVVTDNVGNRQWVEDGVNGRLVKHGDVNRFSSALLELAGDIETRARMGNLGRKVVERRANWDENVMQLVKAYRRLSRL